MRVLLVNDFYAPHMVGGAETLVQSLARTLSERGHEVEVCTARIGELPSRSVEGGVSVRRIGRFPAFRRAVAIASGTAPSRPSRDTLADFAEVLSDFAPDVVHFHNPWLLGPRLIRAAAQPGVRVGVTLHDYWPICVRRSMIRVNRQPCPGPDLLNCRLCRLRAPSTLRSLDLLGIEREMAEHARLLGECDFVTAPSRFVADRVSRSCGVGVIVVPNGIDTHPRPAAGEEAPVTGSPMPSVSLPPALPSPYVLFPGRATSEKGYPVALSAFRGFGGGALAGHTLVVAGDPPRRGIGGARPAPAAGKNVLLLGKQPPSAMPALMAGAACVVVPSTWPEPFGLVIVEAMLAGVPVVASRIGGIPELVEEGVTGLLVEPSDAAALASAIARACTDETLRESARRNGPVAVAERYSTVAMTARLEGLYAA